MTDISTFSTLGSTRIPDCGNSTPCPTTPACPACGGLECLCRPRFFAGQLLTEEDLNRLENYLVAKSRLHNRYLVGTGVACGMEVSCNTCGPNQASGKVGVSPGYAVSPCGNDIILCGPTMVDVCQLIQACTPQATGSCTSMSTGTQASFGTAAGNQTGIYQDCTGGTTDWVLAVCYQEQPTRPIGALAGVNTPTCTSSCGCGGGASTSGCGCGGSSGGCASCGSGCGCGGSGGGGCGCQGSSGTRSGGASAPMGSATSSSPGAGYATRTGSKAISCEPTLICEGYRFVAYPAPTSTTRGYGAAALRVLCCLRELLTNLYAARNAQLQTAAQSSAYLVGIKNVLASYVNNGQFYDCALATRLAAIAVPAPTQDAQALAGNSDYQATLTSLADVGAALIRKCLCAALLPPCPPQAPSDCVPLATVTVTNGTCRVVSVCNIGARKFLVTMPNLQYWLSLFTTSVNGMSPLQAALEKVCCPAPDTVRSVLMADGAATAAAGALAATPAAAQRATAVGVGTGTSTPVNTVASGQIDLGKALATNLLSAAIAAPDRGVDAQTLFLGALGMADASGQPLISDAELSHPSDFLMLNQVVAPVLQQILPDGLMAALASTAAANTPTANTPVAGTPVVDVAAMSAQIAALTQQLASHQQAIEQLKKRKG